MGVYVQHVVFGIFVAAIVGIHGNTGQTSDPPFCQGIETPYVKMCSDHSVSGDSNQSVFIDTTIAPNRQKVECNCTIELEKTAIIQVVNSVKEPDPDCNVTFRFAGDTDFLGCSDKTMFKQIRSGQITTYIKNNDDIHDWNACIELRPTTSSTKIKITCYPYRVYYSPDEDVDGQWGSWSPWRGCTASCGEGTETRTRYCNNPSPQNSGALCVKTDLTPGTEETESNTCSAVPCAGPVDGQYSEWTSWSICSKSCDGGIQTRNRYCNNPAPQNGGTNCTGDPSQSQHCNTSPCPVDGQYSEWGAWGVCSQSCGDGIQVRNRLCNNPEPQNGGQPCMEAPSQTQTCYIRPCPVDGQYSEWGSWGTCSVSCGGGIQTSYRSCNNPPPQNGGLDCEGSNTKAQPCQTQPCPGQTVPPKGTPRPTTTTTESTGNGKEQAESQKEIAAASSNLGPLIGGIIGSLLVLLLIVLLLICFIRRRRKKEDPKQGPRSVRYMSGDDVTVTENELYNYDGETPAHATNALFIGGIPETPSSPGYIPHFSTDTGDRYAMIVDSTRAKPHVKERPSLHTFQPVEKTVDLSNTLPDKRVSTDSVKLAEGYTEDMPGVGVDNPGYDGTYLAPYDTQTGHKPHSGSSSSSPYDYIDHAKLQKDDEEYEREQAVSDYATLPDERDDTESEYTGDYKRFINKPLDEGSDGYLKSPTREKTFEYPDLN